MLKFNKEGYENLLDALSNSYTIVSFKDAHNVMRLGKRDKTYCVIRHDVDYCLQAAEEMAQIEFDKGIQSTYYLLVDSDNYNILSKKSGKLLSEICRKGHEVGLHFDIANYPFKIHKETIQAHISILEKITKTSVSSLSFHNPSLYQEGPICLDDEYYGYLNTYSKKFSDHFSYVSDSLCRFREVNIMEKINSGHFDNLHILLHPIWWCRESEGRDNKIYEHYEKNMNSMIKDYETVLIKSGLK